MYFVMIYSFLTGSSKTYSGVTHRGYVNGLYKFGISTGGSQVSIISLFAIVALMKPKSDQIHILSQLYLKYKTNRS